MIWNTCGKFQSNIWRSYLENSHLLANLSVGILNPKETITHPLINSELLYLLSLIGFMIRNTFGKFQCNISDRYGTALTGYVYNLYLQRPPDQGGGNSCIPSGNAKSF